MYVEYVKADKKLDLAENLKNRNLHKKQILKISFFKDYSKVKFICMFSMKSLQQDNQKNFQIRNIMSN